LEAVGRVGYAEAGGEGLRPLRYRAIRLALAFWLRVDAKPATLTHYEYAL
jgi:hypothetical protein